MNEVMTKGLEKRCDACGAPTMHRGWMRVVKEFKGKSPNVDEPVVRLCAHCNNIMDGAEGEESRKQVLMILYLNWFCNLPSVVGSKK